MPTASANPTLLDIAVLNGGDAMKEIIDETAKATPEVRVGQARTIKGIQYKTIVRTALPTTSFRGANEGVTPSKSTYENRLVECFILNPRWECDKAVADAYEDGAEALIAMEGQAHLLSAFQVAGRQFYYGAGAGNGGDAKGHPGLIDQYDATNMVVDAGGTTASTGSSVWAVKFGPSFVQWVAGNNGAFKLEDVSIQRCTDGSGNPFTAYVEEIISHIGVQMGNLKAVGRIKKLTADSGKGLTDDLLSDLIAKFQVGVKPDAIFMTRRSLSQLRKSRTATNVTGAPAPTPTEFEGIPIEPTDSILDTESLTL